MARKEPFGQFNQTWHKASLGEGYISLFNEGPRIFPRGIITNKRKFKRLLQNHLANFNQIRQKASLGKEDLRLLK